MKSEECYADGVYNRSLEKDQQAGQEYLEMVLSCIQGAPSRFELTETEQGLNLHDTKTGKSHQVGPARRLQEKSLEQEWLQKKSYQKI